jgi:putative phosphoesterase
MRIGVIADTHDHLPPVVLERFKGVDEVWHLGDVTSPSVLGGLSVLGVPLHVVRGNCDWNGEWPITLDLEREGFRFRLIHIPPGFVPADVEIVLHGHTHIPRDETVGKVRYLNPGTAGKPNKGAPPSIAFLTLEAGKPAGWKVVRI